MERARQPALIAIEPDILLVEDNPADAQAALSALAAAGFEDRVVHVSDGGDALDYIASARGVPAFPKLILLDLNLRQLGGLHVLRQLKSDERTKSIPVVVLTSSRLAIELVESYKLGVNSYVIKPVDADKFNEVLGVIARYWLVINELPRR